MVGSKTNIQSAQYADGTMLAEMVMDIYASTRRAEITILHDRPFEKKLVGLEFYRNKAELILVFEGERKPLGVALKLSTQAARFRGSATTLSGSSTSAL